MMCKKLVVYPCLFLLLFACNVQEMEKGPSVESGQMVDRNDEFLYGLSAIGEKPIEEYRVEAIRIFLVIPFSEKSLIVKMRRYPSQVVICKKGVVGLGIVRDYEEVCKTYKLDKEKQDIWNRSVADILSNRPLKEEVGNDDYAARIELAIGKENVQFEESICEKVNWPLLLVETILGEKLHLELPKCPTQ